MERHPGSRETPESLRDELVRTMHISKADSTNRTTPDLAVKEEGVKEEAVKEETVKEEIVSIEENTLKQELDEDSLTAVDNSESNDEVSREKWACPQHYIHLFYDDQDKSVECVLTQQLLDMRKALEPK